MVIPVNTNKPKQGDKVSFWLTVNRKPVLRTGIFLGYANYNGKAIVETGEGLDKYKHYIKPDKLILLKENNQEEFKWT